MHGMYVKIVQWKDLWNYAVGSDRQILSEPLAQRMRVIAVSFFLAEDIPLCLRIILEWNKICTIVNGSHDIDEQYAVYTPAFKLI